MQNSNFPLIIDINVKMNIEALMCHITQFPTSAFRTANMIVFLTVRNLKVHA
jgi:hypothetical protein